MGINAYQDDTKFFRGRNFRFENKNAVDNRTESRRLQRVNVDGEDLLFKDFVKFEVIPGGIDFIVDFDYIY